MYIAFGTIHGFRHPLGVSEDVPPWRRGANVDYEIENSKKQGEKCLNMQIKAYFLGESFHVTK